MLTKYKSMKIHLLILMGLMVGLIPISAIAQIKETGLKYTKIDVFTPKEKDQIQLWLNDKTEILKLSPQQSAEYGRILLNNVNSIFNLTDGSKDYSVNEIEEKTKVIFKKINQQMKPILNADQFTKHQLTMKQLESAYINRLYHPSEETNFYNYLKGKGELVETGE